MRGPLSRRVPVSLRERRPARSLRSNLVRLRDDAPKAGNSGVFARGEPGRYNPAGGSMNDKELLRESIRRWRRALDPSVVSYKSRSVTERAVKILRSAKPASVLTFAGLPGEPDTRALS